MAEQKQKKKSTAAKSAARGGSKSSARGKGGKKAAARPVRREIGAFVCLFLGIFTVLCCFHVNAVVLNLMASLFKGTIGAGFYILPFSFLLGFLILLLHDGRPVALRVTCAFLLAATIGALAHVFSGGSELEWSWEMFGGLWDGGISGAGGGILSGFLAELLSAVISRIGAAIVLLAALLLELITCLNMTIGGILTAIRERPRAEYAEPQREHPDPAQVIVNHVAQKQIERTERKRSRMSEFDLPVDDPPMPVAEPEAGKKGKKNAPVRPDVFVENSRRKAAEEKAAETAGHGPDILAERPKPVKDYKKQLEALRQEELAKAEQRPEAAEAPQELPHQFPPLILENRSADGEETEAAEAPEPVEEPLPEPVCMLPEKAAPVMPLPPIAAPAPDEKPIKKEEVHQEAAKIAQEIVTGEQLMIYHYPPVELLRSGDGSSVDGTEEMRQNADRLSDTLQSFGIEAHIINVTRGPSVTRYELELQRGVKLSKVTNLADDIALALGASGVRIAAIPDKISVVGIEVPNRIVSVVMAREVIDSPEFAKHKSKVSFAVGKDIGGNRIIGDIGKLPHLLIAGTTGSGKSVCMNSLIISLLYKAKPEEVKLIMIDPKMVELGIYNGIPHLLIPVVTDPKKAAGSLQWAVTEMMRRYRMMADAGVRDLESYNKQARMSADDELEPMPQIVVVIDELADLMLVAAKEVEESICRIAQMGRASGIHLVIATQRPSADVITGLMKANIPSRIAFAVASAMESRIILDTAGAEKLVGKGDMLYAPLGQGKPKRVQGCFITDNEVQDVVTFIKDSSEAEYSDSVMAEIDKKAAESGKSGSGSSGGTAAETESSDGDEMLPAAVDVILETGQASVSMLQRRLKLGYARAARIMDEMEERGIVGPFEGSKPRQLLITREQWQAIKDGAPISSEPVEEEIP